MQATEAAEKITVAKAAILGIIQGATEFLPVSSSGHLVLGNMWVGGLEESEATAAFAVVLHLGTLLAVCIVFWKPILSIFGEHWKVGFTVAVGTVPAVVVGLLAHTYLEQAFDKLWVVALGFFITSMFLLTHEGYAVKDERIEKELHMITVPDALIIGLAQALAILPGASRSGLTICTGRMVRIGRLPAATFSFLLAIPAILGAVVIEKDRLLELSSVAEPNAIAVGFVAALVTGLLSLLGLVQLVKRGRLSWFGLYTLILGVGTLWVALVR